MPFAVLTVYNIWLFYKILGRVSTHSGYPNLSKFVKVSVIIFLTTKY